MSKRIATNVRQAGEALGRLTSLRNLLTIPAMTMVLILSRTLNVCAAALFAYAAFLVANPTVVATRYGRIARRPQTNRGTDSTYTRTNAR
jgi:hypothetical protein